MSILTSFQIDNLRKMPTDDPDKLYVKKHKINGLLNDLYTTLTQNKPEDPIEFCVKHFESKLDPEKKADLGWRLSVATSKNPLSEENAAGDGDEEKNLNAGRNLLTQLLSSKKNLVVDSGRDEANKSQQSEPAVNDVGINLISQLNIMVCFMFFF